ncbi:hypothetical protein BGZ79_004783, partial [Entomortierella chlamydospora]
MTPPSPAPAGIPPHQNAQLELLNTPLNMTTQLITTPVATEPSPPLEDVDMGEAGMIIWEQPQGRDTTVIRAEQMFNGSFVFIDVISLFGKVPPINRPHQLSYDLIRDIPYPPSFAPRKDFLTYEEAMCDRDISILPSDGIVMIDRHNSLTYRIKKPTVDLVSHNGYLYPRQEMRSGKAKGAQFSNPKFQSAPDMKDGCIYD